MMKTNFKPNNNAAFAYAMYMIASSYFGKAECKSEFQEANFLLQYKELQLKVQYQMEDICISFMNSLCKAYNEEFWNQKVMVRFLKFNNGIYGIALSTHQYSLTLWGAFEGKGTVLQSRLFKRKSA